MDKIDQEMTRRAAMTASALGGLAVLGAAMASRTAQAADVVDFGATEKAHVQTIAAFFKEWGEAKPDADKILSHMTADCIWRLGAMPAAVGHAAIKERIVKFTANDTHYNCKILDSFARGSMVVHNRVDTTVKAGTPGKPGPIGGVFVMKDGKIHEWYELLYPNA